MSEFDPDLLEVFPSGTIQLPSVAGPNRPYMGAYEPFAELPPELVRQMELLATERRYGPGDHLIRQGDAGDSLMILLSGEVEISVTEGERRHLLKQAGRGEVFGEMALLTRERRTASVVALGPVRALVLPAEEFHRFAANHPQISVVLTHLVAERLGTVTHDALAGKTLQGYRIRRRLGRGAMGLVYEAEDPGGRRVALKMMNHRLVYEVQATEGFQREADIIQSLEHENIARMFDRFAAFHTYFIVMEYCDGMSLDRMLDGSRQIPEADARRILGQLGQAVAFAHQADVIHRDIKPSNILVNRDGVVKLMDFGLARQLEGRSSAPGAGLEGTLAYMAPEQLAQRPVGRAADLFAVGSVAYEMLAGKPLFEFGDVDDLLRQHAAWQLPDLKTSCPGVSDAMCRLLESCLAHDPDERRLDTAAVRAWAAPVDYRALRDA